MTDQKERFIIVDVSGLVVPAGSSYIVTTDDEAPSPDDPRWKPFPFQSDDGDKTPKGAQP